MAGLPVRLIVRVIMAVGIAGGALSYAQYADHGTSPPVVPQKVGDVSAPKLIHSVDPKYSDLARRNKLQGVCVVKFTVDEQGNVQNPVVTNALGMGLDEKAVEAVKKYRFKPAMLRGAPVSVTIMANINFRIY